MNKDDVVIQMHKNKGSSRKENLKPLDPEVEARIQAACKAFDKSITKVLQEFMDVSDSKYGLSSTEMITAQISVLTRVMSYAIFGSTNSIRDRFDMLGEMNHIMVLTMQDMDGVSEDE